MGFCRSVMHAPPRTAQRSDTARRRRCSLHHPAGTQSEACRRHRRGTRPGGGGRAPQRTTPCTRHRRRSGSRGLRSRGSNAPAITRAVGAFVLDEPALDEAPVGRQQHRRRHARAAVGGDEAVHRHEALSTVVGDEGRAARSLRSRCLPEVARHQHHALRSIDDGADDGGADGAAFSGRRLLRPPVAHVPHRRLNGRRGSPRPTASGSRPARGASGGSARWATPPWWLAHR